MIYFTTVLILFAVCKEAHNNATEANTISTFKNHTPKTENSIVNDIFTTKNVINANTNSKSQNNVYENNSIENDSTQTINQDSLNPEIEETLLRGIIKVLQALWYNFREPPEEMIFDDNDYNVNNHNIEARDFSNFLELAKKKIKDTSKSTIEASKKLAEDVGGKIKNKISIRSVVFAIDNSKDENSSHECDTDCRNSMGSYNGWFLNDFEPKIRRKIDLKFDEEQNGDKLTVEEKTDGESKMITDKTKISKNSLAENSSTVQMIDKNTKYFVGEEVETTHKKATDFSGYKTTTEAKSTKDEEHKHVGLIKKHTTGIEHPRKNKKHRGPNSKHIRIPKTSNLETSTLPYINGSIVTFGNTEPSKFTVIKLNATTISAENPKISTPKDFTKGDKDIMTENDVKYSSDSSINNEFEDEIVNVKDWFKELFKETKHTSEKVNLTKNA